MFETSTPFSVFDDLRVPYKLDAAQPEGLVERVTLGDGAPALLWPADGVLQRDARVPRTSYLGEIPLLGRLLPSFRVQAVANSLDGGWQPTDAIETEDGTGGSAIWRSQDGSILLPFDPNEVIDNLRTERYLAFESRRRTESITSLGRQAYYSVRPLMPRRLQLTFRRTFSRLQQRRRFPHWPGESAVDDLRARLLNLVAESANVGVPYIAPWPEPYTWALVLTHDVERRTGYESLDRLLDIELELGYRSSWNFVPYNGYVVERQLIDRLQREGFEVGVHGLFHDGRDLLPGTFAERLPAIRAYAEHWGAVGFRSPGTLRSGELLPQLGLEYDSSFADTSPFEPQAGGCCTWFPFLIDDLVELPITLEQDHTVFDVLRHVDESLWVEKTALIRGHGGMALLITHPDYVRNQHLVDSYRRYLARYAKDMSAWKALPREVSAWWRQRRDSELVEADGEWIVRGPAAEHGRIAWAVPERIHA